MDMTSWVVGYVVGLSVGIAIGKKGLTTENNPKMKKVLLWLLAAGLVVLAAIIFVMAK